ncbi:MAG TPA: CHAT domain-containing protein [Thermoanaerobaculia bacterium]|nr:CHAT domain-containing protein [Thermoanaerobaculia bacterium]
MADGKKKGSTTRKPARPAKKRVAAAAPVPDTVTGHPEFELQNEAVEQALQTGENAGLLEDYFGPEGYAELRQLSREAASRGVRGGPRVLILPGIMGSEIGTRRALPPFNDVYWFDPIDIATGQLSHLALPSVRKLEAVGVILLAYLKLKLRLQISGYNADFHPYDWRLSIADLGKDLAARLQKEGSDVNMVAHSMGGLVARAAIAKGGPCKRLIMLGTPNFGSFAPVQAFRATYPTVLKVAELDRKHDAKQLAGDVFATFPGLTQMMPSSERFSKVDLYDLAMWPPGNDKLRPRKEILAKVKEVQKGLAPADDRFFLIAGVNQETVVGVRRKDDGQFDYELSKTGDGTVPLDFALLPGTRKTYYVEESHGSLPNNKRVAKAVIDLLSRDTTDVLPDTAPPPSRATRIATEAELQVSPYGLRRDGALSQRELRHVLEDVASPSAREELLPSTAVARPVVAVPGSMPSVEAGYQHRFERVVVGRRRQHRIDLRFALGSITEADTRAIVLGIFRDVKPSGAAAAIDDRLEGAITEMSHRRMFSGDVGEIFMLPTGRYALTADLITFVGLGPFDRFNEEVLQTAAENVIRTFVRTRVEEFSTVLFGGSSGESPASALRNLLIGFFRGLCDADRDHQFRRIVVCENNPERYVAIKEELYRLSSTSLCQDVEITFDEEVLRQPPIIEATRGISLVQRRDPTYLIIRAEQQAEIDGAGGAQKPFDIRSAVLTAGGKATVVTGVVQDVTLQQIDEGINELEGLSDMNLADVGVKFTRLIAPEVCTVLAQQRDRHLVVVHDGLLSRVPWETLAFQADAQGALPPAREQITFPATSEVWFPAAERGLSRLYAADNLSVAKWLQERLQDEVLRILLVVNPTKDLPGAESEGKILKTLLSQLSGVRLDELRTEQATRSALLAAFSSGRYDVIHYAGHAFFDSINPERSGLLCHGKVPLTGADLAGLASLPTLVFFNACESARVRGEAVKASAENAAPLKEQRQTLRDATGFAEAFLRGGIANFLGTYWPVGDAAAETFAGKFYGEVMQGKTLGDSLQTGREEVRKATQSKDWADYVFYGNPDFILKEALAAERQARRP